MLYAATIRVWAPAVQTVDRDVYRSTFPHEITNDPKRMAQAFADVNVMPQRFEIVREYPPATKVHPSAPSFILSPHSQRYVTAMLARVVGARSRSRQPQPRETMVLGVTEYISKGHQGLADAMQQVYRRAPILLWGGELFLVNKTNELLPGVIVRANETSGYLEKKAVKNSVQQLLSALAKTPPPLAVSNICEAIEFDPARQHLYPPLNNLAGVNLRHDIMNRIFYINMVLESGLGETTKRPSRINYIHEQLCDKGALVKMIQDVCRLLLEQKQNIENRDHLTALCDMLAKIGAGKKLRLSQYRKLFELTQWLHKFYHDKSENDTGNEYDLFELPAGVSNPCNLARE